MNNEIQAQEECFTEKGIKIDSLINDNTVTNLLNELEHIREEAKEDKLDICLIIKRLSSYNVNDIIFFRDCLQFMLIYIKNV
jgi:hypothetical protein